LNENFISFVIPAMAGIQQQQTLRNADNASVLLRFAQIFNQLDSGLRRNDGLMDNSI
jgi:hypothetical protein